MFPGCGNRVFAPASRLFSDRCGLRNKIARQRGKTHPAFAHEALNAIPPHLSAIGFDTRGASS
jgi:hypothetical protein